MGIGNFRGTKHVESVDCVWNVMAHAQKPDFVFRRSGRVHLNRRGHQFCRLLAGELCISACRVCTARAGLCSAVMWRLLVTHSIFLFPLHFSTRASPCAITFQLDSTTFSPWFKVQLTGCGGEVEVSLTITTDKNVQLIKMVACQVKDITWAL